MSDSTTRSGVQLDLQRGPLSLPFTEREYDYTNPPSDATARTTGQELASGVDQTPLDRDAAKVRTFDINAIQVAAVGQEPLMVLGKTRVDLPRVLHAVHVTYSKSTGAGTSSFPASHAQGAISGSGSISLDPRSSAQGSASVSPTITWDMEEPGSLLVDCEHYFFYATSPMSMANALTKINTVAPSTVANLPLFYDREIQLVLKAAQSSVRASASTHISVAESSGAGTSSGEAQYGNETSEEVGQQTQREVIPACLRDNITISPSSDTQTATAAAEASTTAQAVGAISISAITNTASKTGTATASITNPTTGAASIAITSPKDIPRSGRYLVGISGEEDIAGLVKAHAIVVDFSQYVWP